MRNAACKRPCFRSTGATGLATFALLQLAVGALAAEAGTFENAELRYSITLPAGCRYQEGPGTLEAVCSPELDPTKSHDLPSAGAFILALDVESVRDDVGRTAAC
jgi:hypothetical protein